MDLGIFDQQQKIRALFQKFESTSRVVLEQILGPKSRIEDYNEMKDSLDQLEVELDKFQEMVHGALSTRIPDFEPGGSLAWMLRRSLFLGDIHIANSPLGYKVSVGRARAEGESLREQIEEAMLRSEVEKENQREN